ncbi:MAG TPA: hypothetical protein D7I11_07990 [Candidatus Poseidoniales archaeon]|nr:MAG TPA: hypothetical protein D7I11_07990 [Candidatus Poseidoniales archaeon]HII28351.1 hypothetical protein [Poseidonia sp.]|tara:strand:+ start:481 stop:864 length:384 start_codon:yes stop_codon:yes gene_type:complete
MAEEVPFITLVKREEVSSRPLLSVEDLALENTLSMLCSFLSLEDFISFLSSPMFASYARRDEPWVVFEIGLYRDHTKTLQLYPERECLTVTDEAMTGALDQHVWKGQADDALVHLLETWVGEVASGA